MKRAVSLVNELWNDQAGFVITAELVLISTLLVLGLIVGLTSVQSAVVGELEDVGTAIGSLNQSYHVRGMMSRSVWCGRGVKAYSAGSAFEDLRDECDAGGDGRALNCAASFRSPDHEREDDGRNERFDKDRRDRRDRRHPHRRRSRG